MKKTIILLALLLGAASNGYADEFVVKSFEEVPNDAAAVRYEKLDVNDDPCAIIKVRTDLKSLLFDSNRGIVGNVEQKEGEYWLYVSPTERRLTIFKEGFIKLSYNIPVVVKSSSVYVMVLTRKGGAIGAIDKDLFQVVFKLNEAEVFISKDDGAPLKTKEKAALFSLPEGQYRFKFAKDGFADQTQDIQVEKNETIQVEMKPGASKERMRLLGIVTINSDPQGAEVFLNDQKLFETPHQDNLIAGEYTLVLRKKLYYPHTSRFTIEEGESKQIPMIVLKPRFATYTIRTTPEDANVYVGGKRLDPASRTKRQVESGSHTIRVEKRDYHPQERTVELKDGEDKTFSFDLIPTFGELVIHATPEKGTRITINGIAAKANPYRNERQPSGTYTIRVNNEWYHAQEKIIELRDGEKESFSFDLIPTFGELVISATPEEGTRITINGIAAKTNPYRNERQPSGTYTIEVSNDLYHPQKKVIELGDGEKESARFDLRATPAYGRLIIRSEPEQGAAVIVDGKKVGTTPYTNKTQPSGTYSVRIEKEMWLGSEKSVTVNDGETTERTFVLIKNFAQLRVSSKGATLYLNDKQMGKDAFSKELLPGKYTIRAVQPKHHDAKKELFLKTGDEETIQLKPEPRMGSVTIISKPADTRGARIFVDDEEQKDKPSPAVLPLLIGEYKITLKHPRYLDSSQRVSLAEREQKKLIFNMQTYTGSMLQKANRCRTHKWIGWVSGFALLGAGFYCNTTANGYYDDYQAARDIDGTVDARENTERFDQYRNYSYYVSVAPFVYGIVSWARQSYYEKKSR